VPPPQDLSHVKPPWDPAQALKRWQDDGMQKVKAAGEKAAKDPQPAPAASKHAGHHSYAEDWLRFALDKMMWKKDDSTGEMIGKFAFMVVLGPPIIMLTAIWGNFFDKLSHLGELVVPESIRAPLPSPDAVRDRYGPQPPDVSHGGSPGANFHPTGTSVAHETVPPPRPEPVRDRNKCPAPSRGTK
jgi:hypothetical protein